MEPYNTELTTKTIRFPKDLQNTIEQLAEEAERDFFPSPLGYFT